MRTALSASAIALSLAFAAAPVAAQPALPAAVTAALKENAGLCSEAGGKPDTSKTVKTADLNGDGKSEHVLFLDWIDCAGAASLYGDREKTVMVYDGGAGTAPAFTGAVFDAKLEGSGGTTRLWLSVSGADAASPRLPTSPARTSATARWSGTRRRGSSNTRPLPRSG